MKCENHVVSMLISALGVKDERSVVNRLLHQPGLHLEVARNLLKFLRLPSQSAGV